MLRKTGVPRVEHMMKAVSYTHLLSSVFSSFDTDISMDLLSGRNARKTGSVSGKYLQSACGAVEGRGSRAGLYDLEGSF